jgi:hypothetical protein
LAADPRAANCPECGRQPLGSYAPTRKYLCPYCNEAATLRDAARIPDRDEHQARIDHATWIAQRRRENRCICVTCWSA